MRRSALICLAVLACVCADARDSRPAAEMPTQFEIGRHTFFDFGPPTDYYELLVIRPTQNGSSIERITLTPGYTCTPAKVEVASASTSESVADLLGNTNPCTIPEKELHRELKRCKKCLVFSGANVAMQFQCGTQSRILRADILDRDMFDPAPNTPEHTSWTMRILQRIDQAVGPGVMDKPIFDLSESTKSSSNLPNSEWERDLSLGSYDALFASAPDKPSDLYRAARNPPPPPAIRLVSSEPFRPLTPLLPAYPPIAKLARVEGQVAFKLDVDKDGKAANFVLESGHPLLRGAVEQAVGKWVFPADAANQHVEAVIEFKTNCAKN
jgi:Gram-negative bacterial TonB protein C-terminal